MGMFDSLYGSDGVEWQTKAFGRTLTAYQIGDPMPVEMINNYQMQVIGGPHGDPYRWTYATVRDGKFAKVPDDRDESLPLLEYSGGWNEPADRTVTK